MIRVASAESSTNKQKIKRFYSKVWRRKLFLIQETSQNKNKKAKYVHKWAPNNKYGYLLCSE